MSHSCRVIATHYKYTNSTPFRYWLIIKRYWVKLAAVSITWFLYDWITYRMCGHLIPQLIATDDSSAFGLYATPITDAADPNGTLYTSIGWGCLINFFYLVCASQAMLWFKRADNCCSPVPSLVLSSSTISVPSTV